MTETVSDDAPSHPPAKERSCPKHGAYTAEHLFAGIYEPCPGCLAENEKAPEPEGPPKFDREAYRLTAAGVTKRFEAATFETFTVSEDRQRAVFELVRGYAVDFRHHFKAGRSLVMLGRPGTGKTHLGFSILRHLIAESDKFSGKLVTVSELFRTIKSSWDKASKLTEAEAIARFVGDEHRGPHLLVIDELGVQFDSQTEQSLFYEVINGRYQKMLPTVLISNLTRTDLLDVIGSRSFDRLRENGGMLASFDWESHRGR